MYLMQIYFKECGGIFDTNNGSIEYPESNTTLTYKSNMNCAWIINVNLSLVINISFVWIDTEKSINCSLDYVEVSTFCFYFVLLVISFDSF